MIQAIVFDMDGLLVDSEPGWEKARQDLAARHGKHWSAENQKSVMGVSTQEWVEYMIQQLDLDLAPEKVQAAVLDRLAELYREKIPFLPGSVEAVHLAARHYPTALASGSHRSLIDIVLQDPRMQGIFKVVLSADEVTAGKPAPDVYLEAARRLNVPPEACVCLEDSANGILSGRAAGMKVIAVPDPRRSPAPEVLEQADLVLDSLTQFSLTTLQRLEEV